VTMDGAETDLDLGNYERFVDICTTQDSNVTSGQIYLSVISRERRGDFLGGTIQVVPHVTNEIKNRFKRLAEKTNADIVLIEVGGTVGDIEGLPFLEAIRQMRKDAGRDNVLYIHVTLLPYLHSSGELKTKPTQHSVNELRRIGIQPDVILCRSDYPIPDGLRDKISLFCDVDREAVIPLETVSSVYEVPLVLEKAGIGKLITDRFGITTTSTDLNEWSSMVTKLKDSQETVNIVLVGKYVELSDSYYSVREALQHAALFHGKHLQLNYVHSEELEKTEDVDAHLKNAQGIVIPGGFGIRGIEGMVKAARYARENKIPYLGLCLGMQVMVIEFARYALKNETPNSTEFNPTTPYPVIDLMPDQRGIDAKGHTMRLGNYPCHLVAGTRAAKAYACEQILERHRHRFEFNNDYRVQLQSKGLVLSGLSPDGRLVEISEVSDHPWMVGSQFHPEFLSRPMRPHPLFRDFIGAAKEVMREGTQRALPLTN
ncbi:MAG TPA: CTP synthase, partial [Dehalococcoidales bacterium]|nr:CTP synthase [Dehalococcoidales bacterium]